MLDAANVSFSFTPETLDRVMSSVLNRLDDLERKPAPVAVLESSRDKFVESTISANTTFSAQDLNTVHYINCTSTSTITLPTTFAPGSWITFVNLGSATLSIGTIAALPQDSYCHIPSLESSSAPIWPTLVPVYGKTGVITTKQDIVWDTTSYGPVLKDTNGHYWRITVNTSGTQVVTDTGTTPPL